MTRKKGLTIAPNDICYEEPCEEIGFEDPSKIKGILTVVKAIKLVLDTTAGEFLEE